jgi:perosamine synthetase
VRHGAHQVIFEEYAELGFNYRMTDIQGAVGREQLEACQGSSRRREQVADATASCWQIIPGLEASPVEPSWARSNWQSYACACPRGATSETSCSVSWTMGLPRAGG